MADTLPSQEMALAYVARIEQDWGYPTRTIISVVLHGDEGEQVWRIQTNNNLWDVWQRPDGRVYGEC